MISRRSGASSLYIAESSAKLVSCLRELGLNPTMRTFEERKRAQKLAYLLVTFGVKLPFHFRWYLHGPYSPELTNALYAFVESDSTSDRIVSLSEDEREKINSLKKFLGDVVQFADTLELLVSTHFVLAVAQKESVDDKEALRLLKEKKPSFSEEQITQCYQRVKTILE